MSTNIHNIQDRFFSSKIADKSHQNSSKFETTVISRREIEGSLHGRFGIVLEIATKIAAKIASKFACVNWPLRLAF